MKRISYLFLPLLSCIIFLQNCDTAKPPSDIITTDIDHFWEAYDQITATTDSASQYQLLDELFLSKGTPALGTIMEVRDYTPKTYIDAINQYPKFWSSIRPKMMKAPEYADQIAEGVERLRAIYPELKPAKVYFTVGCFRTPGTTLDSMVLIGSELALADQTIETSEFPPELNYVKDYYQTNPSEHITFLNVHEFVHTQQEPHDYVLIYRTVNEGVAEFIAEVATETSSTTPAIAYGKAHPDAVREAFVKEMFTSNGIRNWLYNSKDNQFETRDLGYYVGYAICEKYYQKAADKNQAVKDLITLDYNDEAAFSQFIDASGYFNRPYLDLKAEYDMQRPTVSRIEPFENGAQDVAPGLQRVTIYFSTKMNADRRGFDFGPLGQEHVLFVKNYLGFSEDGMSMSFETDLAAEKQLQVILTNRFTDSLGRELVPYLIDIKTKK